MILKIKSSCYATELMFHPNQLSDARKEWLTIGSEIEIKSYSHVGIYYYFTPVKPIKGKIKWYIPQSFCEITQPSLANQTP